MNNSINEASLSRVWQHFKNKDTTIVIFTAFRDENTYDENIKRNKQFASKLKQNKFGYFYVEGHFPENEGTSDEVDVKEDSIFAIAGKGEGKKLIDLAHKLANSANQDSIIVKDSDSDQIYFLTQSGKKEVLDGELKPGSIGKYYTKLRNKKETFIFENEKLGTNGVKSFREFIASR